MGRDIELAAWYRIGTVMVAPMKTDSLYPMTAKEAICMGLPVITCKGEMSLGQSKTESDIYDSLIYAFENQEKVRAHIINAFEFCLKYHSIYASVEQHLDFYNTLIKKKEKSTSYSISPSTPILPISKTIEVNPGGEVKIRNGKIEKSTALTLKLMQIVPEAIFILK